MAGWPVSLLARFGAVANGQRAGRPTGHFRTMKRKSLLILPMLLCGACYQYLAAAPESVQPGQVVHVTLTEPGSSGLSTSIGPNATALDGRVLTRAGGDVTLALTQIARSSGP